MTDTPSKKPREFKQWYIRDNFYLRGVLHPVGDIFGTQLDVHVIEYRAYSDLLAKHERVLQMLEIAKSQLKSCKGAMKYAYEDRCDQYYLNVAENTIETLAQIESLK